MKQVTAKEHQKAVNRVVDYINHNLEDSLDLQKLAEVAGLSEYHFHRVFKATYGENIGEYIVRLRLENAAQLLKVTESTLDAIALKCGYQTKHALSKAFKKHFGVSPSAYRKRAKILAAMLTKYVPPKTTLNPLVKRIPAKRMVYVRVVGSPESYGKAWHQLVEFGKAHQLLYDKTDFIGLSLDDPSVTQPDQCRFYACMTVNTEVKPIGEFGTQTIDGGLYAIFTFKGAYNGLMSLYYNIYMFWLPESSYRLRKGISFERYVNHPTYVAEQDLITEVYIPIR